MAKTPLEQLPVLPLRDMVVYPHGVHPLFVGTESSIRALDAAMADSKKIFLIAKRDSDKTDLEVDDLYTLGTVATILQLLKLPDGTVKVLVEGGQRAEVATIEFAEEYIRAEVTPCEEELIEGREAEALVRTLLSQFEQFAQSNKKNSPRGAGLALWHRRPVAPDGYGRRTDFVGVGRAATYSRDSRAEQAYGAFA
jgi:ATP-dependent Lon protease